MKTLWGLMTIIAFATILFTGVSIVNNEILITNSNLNQDSIDKIATYDNQIQNLSNLKNEGELDYSLSSNNTNQVDAFFREAAENKNSVQKFLDGLEYIWDLPEILLLSLPFVEIESSGFITFFKSIIWFMISALLVLVFYKAIRTGKVDEE